MLKVTNAILSARDATLVIGGRTILDHVNLDVRPNEIVTVIGPNGAGKSTLVRCLLGLQPLTSGEIIRPKALRIGYVPQRFPLTANVPLDVRAKCFGVAVPAYTSNIPPVPNVAFAAPATMPP